jgi:hypothetical protein
MVDSMRRLLMDMQEANRLRQEFKIAEEMEEAKLLSQPGTAMKSLFPSADESPLVSEESEEDTERVMVWNEEEEHTEVTRRGPRAPARRVVGLSRMSSAFGSRLVAPSPPGAIRAGTSTPQVKTAPGEKTLSIELPPISAAAGGPNSPGRLAPINQALIKGAMHKTTAANCEYEVDKVWTHRTW